MIMEATTRSSTYSTLLSLLMAAAWSGVNARTRTRPPKVNALLASLEPYSSLTLAKKAGYGTALTDSLANGHVRAMGIHYANPALIDDTRDEHEPEAVPVGRAFTASQVFGLWTLHVWTHRANPSGLFAPWNPRVRC